MQRHTRKETNRGPLGAVSSFLMQRCEYRCFPRPWERNTVPAFHLSPREQTYLSSIPQQSAHFILLHRLTARAQRQELTNENIGSFPSSIYVPYNWTDKQNQIPPYFLHVAPPTILLLVTNRYSFS